MLGTKAPSIFSGLLTDLLTSYNTFVSQLYQNIMVIRLRNALFAVPFAHSVVSQSNCSTASGPVDLTWHAPNATNINDLGYVVNGTGIDGFVFNTSITPASVSYSTYNWCNMPHVRAKEYPKAPQGYTLAYLEIVGPCSPSLAANS